MGNISEPLHVMWSTEAEIDAMLLQSCSLSVEEELIRSVDEIIRKSKLKRTMAVITELLE